jgi:hypothetical protein
MTKLNKSNTTNISKKILPLMIAAVLSVSLAGITIAAEDFGCACHPDVTENFTALHWRRNEGRVCKIRGRRPRD